MAWEKLTTLDELTPGSLMEVERGDYSYALCNVGGEVRAIWGSCPHHGGPLGQGALNGDMIACPWHMWEFDSITGACSLNKDVKIAVYEVRIEDRDVMVNVPA